MYKSITTQELANLIKKEQIELIDVREPYEHQFGHIKEAKNIPLNTLAYDFQKYLNTSNTYYIICQSGGRSASICQYLSAKGYKVVNVLGGHSAWPYDMVR